MIKFHSVKYKNFLSTGNVWTTIQLDKSSTTLVVGRNGSGKSSILDAITFGLFGKPFRNINIPQLVNGINEKNCLVEVQFSIGSKRFKVERGIKPKIFNIFCDDALISQDADNRDYQKLLEQSILKMNISAFKQIVVLGSANYVPFMQLPAAERRNVIEELLEIRIYSTMSKIAKGYSDTIASDIRTVEPSIVIAEERYNLEQEYLRKEELQVENRIASIQKILDQERKIYEELDDKIVSITGELAELSEKTRNHTRLEKILKEMHGAIAKVYSSIERAREEKTFFQTNDHCITCHQEISPDHKAEMVSKLEKKETSIEQRIQKMQEMIDETQNEYEILKENLETISKLERRLYQHRMEKTSKSEYIDRLLDDIRGLSNSNADSNGEKSDKRRSATSLAVIQKEIDALKKRRNELVSLKGYYDLCASLLIKDGGLKTKVIRQYVPMINSLINKYLKAFNLPINFILDETFKETINARFKEGYSYESFSEGEKSRIDLSLMLAWRGIAKAKNSVNTNLLIFDEILDSSADEEAIEELMNILKGMEGESNIFVISHRSANYDKFRSMIQFEKKGQFSSIIAPS